MREFERFAPSIKVQTYYGSKDDRHNLREELRDSSRGKHHTWEVLITTYNLAVGDDLDRRFFRKVGWNVSDTSSDRFPSLTGRALVDMCL